MVTVSIATLRASIWKSLLLKKSSCIILNAISLHACEFFFKVGALEACYLAKRGYEVHLYEYRKGKILQ